MLIVEDVIQKASVKPRHLLEKEEELGPIEKRIQEQKQRVNPFKKSAVYSTTFEIRQRNREKEKAKQDRIENKR